RLPATGYRRRWATGYSRPATRMAHASAPKAAAEEQQIREEGSASDVERGERPVGGMRAVSGAAAQEQECADQEVRLVAGYDRPAVNADKRGAAGGTVHDGKTKQRGAQKLQQDRLRRRHEECADLCRREEQRGTEDRHSDRRDRHTEA